MRVNNEMSSVFFVTSCLCVFVFLFPVFDVYSYSVLTHEAVVDSMWRETIEPMLRQRFPLVSDGDLKTAHAFAYGGSIIQDMGYYPFGSHFFTDLTTMFAAAISSRRCCASRRI